MNRTKTIISLATAPVITGAFLASAILSPVSAGEVSITTGSAACNAEVDLQGTVSRNEATVTNHSTNGCEYDAFLAVYESPKEPETYGWIEAQNKLGSNTVKVPAGKTVTIKVDYSSSACYFQSDLIRGTNVLDKPYYRTAMDVDVWSQNCNAPTATPTPTPTSTKNDNNSSTTNTTNNVTNNTTNNVVNNVTEKLASTGDSLIVFAFLVAGVVTLVSGFLLRKLGK